MIGAESGLEFVRFDDISPRRRILEVNGGGVALFDFDRDGWLDMFLTNGCRLPRRTDDGTTRGELFRNRQDVQFERVTTSAILAPSDYTHGCAIGDYDSDGFDDLYVTAYGENAFWRNNGDGTFTDITRASGTAVPRWSSSAAFADVNLDGHLDLYVVNYLDESDESPQLCPHPQSPDGYTSCTPAAFDGVDDVLFLSDGAGHFVDATDSSGIGGRYGKGLGVVIANLDDDGRPEIYVANDGQANFLFVAAPIIASEDRGTLPAAGRQWRGLNPGELRYDERGLASGLALNESGYAQASMGIAAGDYDANGTCDLFLTHFFDDTNTLYANRGGFVFEDATRSSELGPSSRRTLGWGTVLFDADNDGWLDLFVANGHVDDRTWMGRGEPYHMRPQLYRNERNGGFVEVSDWGGEYFLETWLGRGAAVGDLDRDGRLDLAVSHQLAPSLALRNETQTDSASIVLRLVGNPSNRNGYGARVEVVRAESATLRELVGGASFHSASAPEIHLGLGAIRQATIRIRWPSGTDQTHTNVAAGTWTAVEPQGISRSQH